MTVDNHLHGVWWRVQHISGEKWIGESSVDMSRGKFLTAGIFFWRSSKHCHYSLVLGSCDVVINATNQSAHWAAFCRRAAKRDCVHWSALKSQQMPTHLIFLRNVDQEAAPSFDLQNLAISLCKFARWLPSDLSSSVSIVAICSTSRLAMRRLFLSARSAELGTRVAFHFNLSPTPHWTYSVVRYFIENHRLKVQA